MSLSSNNNQSEYKAIFLGTDGYVNCLLCTHGRIKEDGSGTTFQACHIIPASAGGPFVDWNLLPGCGCNQQQKDKHLIDWMGCDGEKKRLLKPILLKKYHSLVPPAFLTKDPTQLIQFVEHHWKPKNLALYSDWLLLEERDMP